METDFLGSLSFALLPLLAPAVVEEIEERVWMDFQATHDVKEPR